jgi:hypothetical protein
MAVNARFLAYPADTPQARDLETKAVEWTRRWTTDAKIGPIFASLVRAARGNPERPLENRAAWESAVHSLREQFTATQLGFGRTALFRIAPQQLIATEQDFQFSFESRKAELLSHWRGQRELDPFWDDRMEIDGQRSAGKSCPVHGSSKSFRLGGRREQATPSARDLASRPTTVLQHLFSWVTPEKQPRKTTPKNNPEKQLSVKKSSQ